MNANVTEKTQPANLPREFQSHAPGWFALAVLTLTALIAGCASYKEAAQPGGDSAAGPGQVSDSAPPPGAEAKINISYAHPGDFLSLVMVTKYASAKDLRMQAAGKDGDASIVRFDGGAVVWQIELAKTLLSSVSVLHREQKHDAPTEVKYGGLPKNFVQTIPEAGPPEPLEADNYYIFAVTRGSGSTNYEAIKVAGDGSLEAYEAEPRAGTSFRLCCNVSADFTVTAGAATVTNSPAP